MTGLLFPRARRRPTAAGTGGRALTKTWPQAAASAALQHPPGYQPAVLWWDLPGLGECLSGTDTWTPLTLAYPVGPGARRPTPARFEQTARQIFAHWRPLDLPMLCGPLDSWQQPLHSRRQRCHRCARRQALRLILDGLQPGAARWENRLQPYTPLHGLLPWPDLLLGWTTPESAWARRLHDELIQAAHPDLAGPTPAGPALCLPPSCPPLLPQNTMYTSGVLPTLGMPRRRLLVVTRGAHALWHLLPRHGLADPQPVPAPATGGIEFADTGRRAGPDTTLVTPPIPEGQRASLACTVESDHGVTTVRAKTHLQLLMDGRPRPQPVPATFTYRSNDPYAVRVVFGERVGTQVEWVFARELLIEGLRHTSGTGDVRVRRQPAVPGREGPDRVHISLSSPEGRAVLSMLPSDLETFLASTRAVVVYGSEHQHMRVPWETLTEELWWHPHPHR